MMQQLLITIGAGVASAVFFFIPVKGSVLAMVVGVFAPLPLMIVTMGYGLRAGAIAAIVGALLIAFVLHPWMALTFLLSVCLPALLLNYIAHSGPFTEGVAPQFAVNRVLVWIVGLTVVLDWLGIFMVGSRYASFDAAVDDLATQFAPLVTAVFQRAGGVPAGFSAVEFAGWLVMAIAPVMAIWGVFALAVNFWLAGRVVQVSGGLARPWPDFSAVLAMPRAAIMVLAIAFAVALLPGVFRVFAMTLAAAIGATLALQGLAVLHNRTQGNTARTGILAGVYGATIFLFPWPLLVAAGLGLIDLVTPLRKTNPNPKPANPKPQGD